MMVAQCQLTQPISTPGASGSSIVTAWLPVRPDLKVGNQVTLKDGPGGWWTVEAVGRQMDSSAINRGWNNNI